MPPLQSAEREGPLPLKGDNHLPSEGRKLLELLLRKGVRRDREDENLVRGGINSRRKSCPNAQAQRAEVRVGHPTGQFEEMLIEKGFRIKDLLDLLDLREGRLLGEADDVAGEKPLPQRNKGSLARLGEAPEGRRDQIGQGPLDGKGKGYLGVSAATLHLLSLLGEGSSEGAWLDYSGKAGGCKQVPDVLAEGGTDLFEDGIEHRLGQAAGLGILAARMIGSNQQKTRCERVNVTVAELRLGARQCHPPLPVSIEEGVKGNLS